VTRQEWRCAVAPGSESSGTGDRGGGGKKTGAYLVQARREGER
jgi:hypothetical protein